MHKKLIFEKKPITRSSTRDDMLKQPKFKAVFVNGVECFVEDNSMPNEGLKWQDFNISSIIEAGATDLLKPTGTISASTINAADGISVLNSQIDSSGINEKLDILESETKNSND